MLKKPETNSAVEKAIGVALPMFFAALAGIGAGFLSVALIKAIDFTEYLFFADGQEWFSFLGKGAIILIPCIGGLLVGLITFKIAPETKGHGVPEVMKAVAVRGGRIRPLVIGAKMLTSSLSIGTGASVGREGPVVQIGAAFGSWLAQLFRMNSSKTKSLVACGSAAGIAAVFNAPIAGVMFSLEVIMRDFGARSLSIVVIAAMAGSIVSRAILGDTPAFFAPAYSLQSPFEMILYLLLGILSAFVGVLFIFILDKSEEAFVKWKCPDWLKPAVGGLAIGLMGFFVPQIFGTGFHTIEDALAGRIEITLLAILVFAKIMATSVSLGSGGSGGTFAPTLFVGAVLGGVVGKIFFNHCPFPVAPPGAYALVGMASVFAGATHAPVTAILLVFELTGDYKLILPIMGAVVVATSITQLLSQESIDTINLKRIGINMNLLRETKYASAISVGEVMSRDFELVSRSMPGKELIQRMSIDKDKIFFVTDQQGHCVGYIDLNIMKDMLFERDVKMIIADDLVVPIVETVYPNDSLSEASSLMAQSDLKCIPVVNPSDSRQIIGVLKHEDFHQAFTQITMKQAELLDRLEAESEQANGLKQVVFIVSSRSTVRGKKIQDLDLPEGIRFSSIERKRRPLIPVGATVLEARDRVWLSVTSRQEEAFENWLKKYKLKAL